MFNTICFQTKRNAIKNDLIYHQEEKQPGTLNTPSVLQEFPNSICNNIPVLHYIHVVVYKAIVSVIL